MMWTLFGSSGSGSAAVEMALLRCGLAFREVRAATWEADSALAELLAANPMQQIPTLVDADGMVLTESAAILMHLGLTHPASRLLPSSSRERAQAMRGLVFVAANCYAAIGVIDYPERWCPDAGALTMNRLRKGASARLHACWDVFADQFLPAMAHGAAGHGGPVGALDILAAVVSRWSGTRGHLAHSRPALLTALQAVEAQPELQPVFHRHWPPAPT